VMVAVIAAIIATRMRLKPGIDTSRRLRGALSPVAAV